MKKYWRILSSYYIDLDDETRYNPIKKCNTSLETLIDDAINLNSELAEAYNYTQSFLKGIREVKYEDATYWIDDWIDNLRASNCKEFRDLASMFSNWKLEITNSFIRFGDKRLHNGYIEGINNKIKVIKRIAYGYTNFTHFRNRIMYIINGDATIKKVNTKNIYRKKRKYYSK